MLIWPASIRFEVRLGLPQSINRHGESGVDFTRRLARLSSSVCLAWLLCLGGAANSNSGGLRIKAELDQIPLHYIDLDRLDHAEVSIALDGVVDEPIWQKVPAYDNMLKSIPGNGEPASLPTEVRMLATERGLYVSAVMYQPPDSLVKAANRARHLHRPG